MSRLSLGHPPDAARWYGVSWVKGMILTVAIIAGVASGLAVVLNQLRKAPLGYEDQNGRIALESLSELCRRDLERVDEQILSAKTKAKRLSLLKLRKQLAEVMRDGS